MSRRHAFRDQILRVLSRPATQAEIRDRTGFGGATVSRWVNALNCQGIERRIRIVDWFAPPNGGPVAAVYQIVTAPDVKCTIKPLTDRQRVRRYRRRQRKSGAWAENLRVQRAYYWSKKAGTRADPLVAAFFGRPR